MLDIGDYISVDQEFYVKIISINPTSVAANVYFITENGLELFESGIYAHELMEDLLGDDLMDYDPLLAFDSELIY